MDFTNASAIVTGGADGFGSATVRAALELSRSDGQVEGQVHRLKLVKRAMYGRASFDLLKERVLDAT